MIYHDVDTGTARYYGDNYPRLQDLKKKWDPDWVLGNFSSGIEPAAKVSHTWSLFDQIRTIFSVYLDIIAF